ncbi:MAG: hypothetical protein IT323_07520 [Anaerolineae bacterium]|nr:hypothetical protein [Anaerolineae bacterium]
MSQDQTPQTPQQAFGAMLDHVMGTAFTAAGYALQPNPMHHMRGLYRYARALPGDVTALVEFQALHYASGPSRFRINLVRQAGPDARPRDERTLAALLWDDFATPVLDGPDHWWTFTVNSPYSLANALAEAGRLLFAFGVPWLEGRLQADGS